jgi:hypothetical protein
MTSTAGSGHQSIDYERHGHGYARHRRPDPRIAARVHAALGDARTVVNVGAGAWDATHGRLRREPGYDGLLVLVISEPS